MISKKGSGHALHKSAKARHELNSGKRVLNLRERGALFLADGHKSQDELQALLRDDGALLEKLISDGYLISIHNRDEYALAPETAAPVLPPLLADIERLKSSSDSFEGKRSLATTRMFMFDICERIFSKKSPALAVHYRDLLREARDRESMMVIIRDIIVNVEEIAGSERADGLSERIAMLLPSEQ